MLGSRTYGSPDDGLFVAPKDQIDRLLERATSRSDIEIALGLRRGTLSEGHLVWIDVDDPFSRGLLPPSEGGIHFRPGVGLTTGGLNEGIIDAPLIGTWGVRKSLIWGR